MAPQGYLVVNGEELVVPCSTAYPARLNRNTGELIEFQLPSPGRFPGGWFAALDPKTARDIRRGRLTFDDVVDGHPLVPPALTALEHGVEHPVLDPGRAIRR